MKTRTLIYANMLSLMACAYTPSEELARAQAAYRRSEQSQTAQMAPAELHQANVLLEAAAALDRKARGSEEAATGIYLARRKIAWADAVAAKKIADWGRADAEKRLVSEQERLLREQQRVLAAGQGTLKEKDREIDQARAEVDRQRQVADEAAEIATRAQKREERALAKLEKAEKMAEDARGRVLTLPGALLFKSGEWSILLGAHARLDEVAQQLRDVPNAQLLIEGHTDGVGSQDFNLFLSARRAQAVRDYLVSRGVDSERIRTQGAGANRPIADNGSSEGRAMNRRVEIVITRDGRTQEAAK